MVLYYLLRLPCPTYHGRSPDLNITLPRRTNHTYRNEYSPLSDHQDFILLVVLTFYLSYNKPVRHGFEWDILDMFAGTARISKLGRARGYSCAAYDVAYHKGSKRKTSKHSRKPQTSAMDILSDAGFSFLGDKSWLNPIY